MIKSGSNFKSFHLKSNVLFSDFSTQATDDVLVFYQWVGQLITEQTDRDKLFGTSLFAVASLA